MLIYVCVPLHVLWCCDIVCGYRLLDMFCFRFCVASMCGRECCVCFGGGMCALISVHLVGSSFFSWQEGAVYLYLKSLFVYRTTNISTSTI